MADIEKVKRGLACCADGCSTDCPYTHDCRCGKNLSIDSMTVIEELQAEIERLQPKWIPVSKNPMPWFNKLVSFKYKGETYFGEGYWSGAKWVVTGFPNNKFPNEIEVTHWMQPPELPKDGDGK